MRHLARLRFVAIAIVLAMLQTWLPVSGYHRLAAQGLLSADICSSRGTDNTLSPFSKTDQGTPAGNAGHGEHCPLCAAGPAAAAGASAAVTEHASDPACRTAPWLPVVASQAPPPPATGPPRLS